METNLQLYIYTVNEYKRFAKYLPIKEFNSLTDSYSEADYVGLQVRLMLLRKYYSDGKKPENVNIKRIVKEAKVVFPDAANELQSLADEFDRIENNRLNIYYQMEQS